MGYLFKFLSYEYNIIEQHYPKIEGVLIEKSIEDIEKRVHTIILDTAFSPIKNKRNRNGRIYQKTLFSCFYEQFYPKVEGVLIEYKKEYFFNPWSSEKHRFKPLDVVHMNYTITIDIDIDTGVLPKIEGVLSVQS